jgi:hypothetical protein
MQIVTAVHQFELITIIASATKCFPDFAPRARSVQKQVQKAGPKDGAPER